MRKINEQLISHNAQLLHHADWKRTLILIERTKLELMQCFLLHYLQTSARLTIRRQGRGRVGMTCEYVGRLDGLVSPCMETRLASVVPE